MIQAKRTIVLFCTGDLTAHSNTAGQGGWSPQRETTNFCDRTLAQRSGFFDVSVLQKLCKQVATAADNAAHNQLSRRPGCLHPPLFAHPTVSHPVSPPANAIENSKKRRRCAADRIAGAHLAGLGGTLGDTVGTSHRARLVWLGLLAMPLLIPVALPGMASAVGVFCLFIAVGLCLDQELPLPRWLARRQLSARFTALLVRMAQRAFQIMARLGRPRLLPLSDTPRRVPNGLVLSIAGLAMVVPVPIVSFDNVLPALAIILISWGLRLRDGLMLLLGYLLTLAAVASVLLFWWGGAQLIRIIASSPPLF